MEKKVILDGPEEMQIKKLKELCGLRPDQSFAEIVIDDEEDNTQDQKDKQ